MTSKPSCQGSLPGGQHSLGGLRYIQDSLLADYPPQPACLLFFRRLAFKGKGGEV